MNEQIEQLEKEMMEPSKNSPTHDDVHFNDLFGAAREWQPKNSYED
jgi:hypothetical protein